MITSDNKNWSIFFIKSGFFLCSFAPTLITLSLNLSIAALSWENLHSVLGSIWDQTKIDSGKSCLSNCTWLQTIVINCAVAGQSLQYHYPSNELLYTLGLVQIVSNKIISLQIHKFQTRISLPPDPHAHSLKTHVGTTWPGPICCESKFDDGRTNTPYRNIKGLCKTLGMLETSKLYTNKCLIH